MGETRLMGNASRDTVTVACTGDADSWRRIGVSRR